MVPLPKVAVMGLFQSGKSTLINSLLSCIAATMGEGLRTSHMAVSYRFGDADWAVGYGADGEQFETTLAEFLAAPEKSPWEKSQSKADVFLHRPILRDVVLVDTPGFDYSDEDNQTATVAADEADGIALLVTKQLPLDNKPLCGFLHRNLHEKPFAVIINCGKDGPHLADSNSIAAARVESAVLLALDSMGLPQPRFTHRINLGMLLDSSCVGGIIGGKWRAKKAGEAHDLAADILTATGLAHLRDKFRLFTCIAANEKERLNQHAEAGAILRYLSEASQRVCWR